MASWKKGLLFMGDVLILYAALAAALLVRYGLTGFGESFANHRAPFVPIFVLWVLVFYLFDLYHFRSLLSPAILFRTTAFAVIAATVVSMGAFYLFPDFFELTPKTNLALFAAFALLFAYGWRTLLRNRFRASAIAVAFLGASPRMKEAIAAIERSPHFGYRVVGRFDESNGRIADELEALAARERLALLIVEPSFAKEERVAKQIYRILPRAVNVVPFASFYEAVFEKIPLEDLSEEWFIANVATRRPFYDRAKRFIDVVLGLSLFVALLPLIALIALSIALTSRGGAIYAQERVGKNGKLFTLYKFRTMRAGSGGPLWTEAHDARITPVGKFLRATHLDELPQLWNVVRGDVSFTGPRPERIELVRTYEKFPYYEMRHVVKPGVTGWAQINFRPSASLEEAYEKLKYDLYYVKNRSLFLDALIILKTIRYFFSNHS